MATSKSTSHPSTTKSGREHSTNIFINRTLVIIIIINMNLTSLYYWS